MGEELTAALFTELELRGAGPGAFMRRTSPDIVAGRGLGDIAALVAADVIDHEHAVELAGLREQLIARANADAGGGLLAVLDIDADAAARCVAALSGARIARHDSPVCVVLAGNHEQLADARAVAGDLCIAVAEVDAPAALHSPAMAAAADRFAAVLERFDFHDPAVPVYSSLTAAPMRDPRAELAAGLDEPVLWTQTVGALAVAGAAWYVEPGSLLGDLVVETLSGLGPAGVEMELRHAA